MLRLVGDGCSARAQRPAARGSALSLFWARPFATNDPLRAVRRPPDPFSLLDTTLDACRVNEETYAIARSLTESVQGAVVDSWLVRSLAVAPLNNMRAFARRRGTIIFADSFLGAAESALAERRRGRPLDPHVRWAYIEFDKDAEQIFGVYDQELDALVFTRKATPLNHERVIVHEFGHAMTVPDWYRVAHLRSDLLLDLPQQILDLLTAYPQGGNREAVRERVLEVLADAYVWMLLGRWDELPARLRIVMQDVISGEALRRAG